MRLLTSLLILIATSSLIAGCARSNTSSAAPAETPNPDKPGAASCALSFPASGLCADLAWVKQPNETENGEFLLTFTRAGQPAEIPAGQLVAVKLWMPDMAHGSSPVTLTQLASTVQVTDVHFVMSGKWEIKVQLRSSGTLLEEAVMPYEAKN